MRTYYIFFIDDAFLLLYRDKPSLLYRNFYHIYKMNNNNYGIGLNIYSQLRYSFNKRIINEYIYNRHGKEISYNNYQNIHIIDNKYTGELTKLTIYNTYIKMSTNKNYSIFFNTLYRTKYNLFICDFNNHDYFWLDECIKQVLV